VLERGKGFLQALHPIYAVLFSTSYPYLGMGLSTKSIESMGLLWRCKWLQMAEEAGSLLPCPRGKNYMVRVFSNAIPPCKHFVPKSTF
jgi:hypothetical protein